MSFRSCGILTFEPIYDIFADLQRESEAKQCSQVMPSRMCFLLKLAYFSLFRYNDPEMLMSSARTHTTCLGICTYFLFMFFTAALGPLLTVQKLLCQHGCQASQRWWSSVWFGHPKSHHNVYRHPRSSGTKRHNCYKLQGTLGTFQLDKETSWHWDAGDQEGARGSPPQSEAVPSTNGNIHNIKPGTTGRNCVRNYWPSSGDSMILHDIAWYCYCIYLRFTLPLTVSRKDKPPAPWRTWWQHPTLSTGGFTSEPSGSDVAISCSSAVLRIDMANHLRH